MKKYKLLLLDVDGTLVKSKDSPVSARVEKAIKGIDKNIHVSLCTGRTHKDSMDIINTLDLGSNYHIIESGAKIINPKGQEENIKSISMADINWILGQAADTPTGLGFCVDGSWVDEISQIGDGKVTTLCLHSHSQDQTKIIIDRIAKVNEKFHVAVGSHWQIKDGNFILITNKDASKKSAIEYLQHKLNILKFETIGIGDMLNDLPLFDASGLKVAMGSGDPGLQKLADFVAPSIDEDGVATTIYKFLS